MEMLSQFKNPDFVKKLRKEDKISYCVFILTVTTAVPKLVDAVSKKFGYEKDNELIKGAVFCVHNRCVQLLWGWKGEDNKYYTLLPLPEKDVQQIIYNITDLLSTFFGIDKKEIGDTLVTISKSENFLYTSAGYLLRPDDKDDGISRAEATIVVASNLSTYAEILKKTIEYDEKIKEDIILDFFNNYIK